MSNIDSNAKIDSYQIGKNHVIENLWLLFHSVEQGQWIMKVSNAVRLHEKLKELNPKHILELGTGIGCSAAIMAMTCPETRIYSVEQNQKCIDIAKKLIPESLQERITFRKATAEVVTIPQVNPLVQWSMYKEFDWIDYDFILVDGPGGWKTNVTLMGKSWPTFAELPNGDLINLLPKMKEGTMVYVDRRKHATILYNRHLQNYLEHIEEDRNYAIYRRNGKQLNADFSNYENSDTSIESLTKGKYFE
ncbi:MAG: hypothetical protein AAB875_05375 [Patescibacteria group bacterium]